MNSNIYHFAQRRNRKESTESIVLAIVATHNGTHRESSKSPRFCSLSLLRARI